MLNEDILNIDELLAPISEDAPAGVDLRDDTAPDAVYYQLKDARNSARAIERNSFPGEENKDHPEKEHWKLILKQAPKALKTQSKDLEIAAWLTEALIREHGFAGLRAGFTLINGLVQNYWDGLYPLPDEDGMSTRVAVLVGLNGVNNSGGTLIAPINTAPITADGLYSAWSYTQALELDKTTDAAAKKRKTDAGAVPLATIRAAVKPSTSDFYFGLQDDLDASLSELEQMNDSLSAVCGDDTPPISGIRKSLEGAQTALKAIAKDILTPVEDFVVDADADADAEMLADEEFSDSSEGGEAPLKLSGSIKGRLEAFKTLQTVADFFKRTEPHSPIGYTLERILRWGDMTLPELLRELVPDPQAQDYFQKLVGIQPPPPPEPMDVMQQNPYNGGGADPYANPDPYSNPNPYNNDFGPSPDPYGNGMFK